jgi:Peptidase A4 family
MGQKGLVRRWIPGIVVLLAGLGAVASAGSHASRVAERGRPAQRQVLTRRGIPRIPGRRFETSTNWSGYALTGSGFTNVQGTWRVPAAVSSSCSSTYSSSWVGIDGYSSGTVEQLGTEQDWSLSGGEGYYAWYEMYPKGALLISSNVRPGDTITASVQYVGNGNFKLTMNSRRGTTPIISFSTTQQLRRAQRSSVEWIEEAPWSGGTLPLANFGSVGFSSLFPTSSSYIPITMVGSATGDTLAVPSGGTSIAWMNCH